MKVIIKADAKEKLLEEVNCSEIKSYRIDLEGVGWGGAEFSVALDESTNDDVICVVEGIKFIMASELEDFGDNFTVGIDTNGKISIVSNDNESC